LHLPQTLLATLLIVNSVVVAEVDVDLIALFEGNQVVHNDLVSDVVPARTVSARMVEERQDGRHGFSKRYEGTVTVPYNVQAKKNYMQY
jgi:hypothetical protein